MIKKEIIKLLTYLNHCYPGKFKFPKTSKRENEMLIEVWYDLLKFYDNKCVISVLKKIIINSGHWPPSVGEIVKEVERIKLPAEAKITAGEAWNLVLRAVRRYGYYRAGEAMKSLPPKVRETVEHFGGFTAICHSDCNNNYVRSHFMKLYKEVNRCQEEFMYLPAAVRDELLEAAPRNEKSNREWLL
ncbi:replicative helicase loader/inhibitor [Halanaerobium sp. ST460_2HS_T2]|uniref:replicative helicase loader/inhibitor n=1 Tax=Halanaerobium sp. ST460_2HS_T2 TaxID=2183914 RepID=UPI000DF15A26|nr:replicative helicase loader/inhibitor [Halanaerobium sp. ST460_2HS_T2]RCW57327.1 loader and inhibitor of G40P protein [Halanaerobium sp. ST460_2HS_T2]